MQLFEGRIYVSLQYLLEKIWKTRAQSITFLGERVYGKAYAVALGCSPYRAIIKIHKYPGLAGQERRQLIHFPARYWFYQVWKWLFYYVRVGTRCREWILRCGRELEKVVDCSL